MKGKRIGKIIFYLFSAVCLLLVLWGLIGKLVAEKKGEKFYLFGYSLEIVRYGFDDTHDKDRNSGRSQKG